MKRSNILGELMQNAAIAKNRLEEVLPSDGPFRAMLDAALSPGVIGCIQDAEGILAFELPEADCKSFLLFHNFVTNPQPLFLADWRATTAGNRWYVALVEGLNGATRNAYSCVLYHFQRLFELESAVMEKISQRNYKGVLGDFTLAIGNTLIWDFEYQALVLAYRRCLDYMARGLAAFFKRDFHSFRELPESLNKCKPKSVADALIEVHKRHFSSFGFVMSHGTNKSIRDKITHYEWVSAATINLSKKGLVLAGGGESLQSTGQTLAEALDLRIQLLKACIDDMLTTFVAEAKAWDLKNGLVGNEKD
jgi:hypothetical protein